MFEEEMLEKKIWAVVGAHPDSEKYSNMIYKKLKRKEYEVYAVNPNYESIEGDKCFKDLTSLPKKPDVINVVVRPQIAMGFIEEAAKLGIEYMWFQPGTHDAEVLQKAEQLGIKTAQACVLVATR